MKPAPFEYHAPTAPDEVVGLLVELGDGAKVLAGGQSLVPILALRLSAFDHLVDLRRVEGLRGIARTNGHVRIGATTTQAMVERSAEVAAAVPLLARATPFIGHFQIRNRGTVGGSLAHADPAAEYPAVALALDAELEILSTKGARTVAAADFFEGLWTTAVGDDELLTAATFPVWDGRCGFAIEELARRHGDFAVAGACVGVGLDAGGQIERCAVSVFGLGPKPMRATTAEASAIGSSPADVRADEIGRAAVGGLDDVPADVHGSADYRRHVGAVMVARAWTRAVEEAISA
ncbi:MAG TPA: FAD binding domain-containing protein [Acidimicrobiales bacterium]|nr:FAD binding domain-containing protein [Acidimicrobiales bacterium]